MKSKLLLACFLSCFFSFASAQKNSVPKEPDLADRIVAIVNDDVITYNELQSKLALAMNQLQRQGTALPPRNVLEEQMLERMVIDKVQLQLAKSSGINIDDGQLEETIGRIAAGNKMTPVQLREALKKDGIAYDKFREEIRDEMTIARLKDREVASKIAVSEGEVDYYLNDQQAKKQGDEYELAHIILRAPESASPAQLQQLQAKAQTIMEKLRNGEDFAKLAAAYSDAPDALQGGVISARSLDRLPTLYAEAAAKLNVGELGPIIRSPNGIHILKLMNKKTAGALPAVQQTHVRHILIKVNELVSEAEARHKLEGLIDRIKHGEKFAELARLYSQDGSASKGGDLGWIYPGDTVPEFEQAMNRLKPGELSAPVQSPFGFHLIEVEERRVQDVSSERQRAAAKQALRERKLDDAYQDWLRQIRDSAYVDIRLVDQ